MVAIPEPLPRIEGSRAHLGRRAVLALALLAAVIALVSLGHGAAGTDAARTLWAVLT